MANDNDNKFTKELTKAYMEKCILSGIKKASKNYYWVSGRGLSKSCACMANNYAMGLKTESCDKTGPIRERDIKKHFDIE